MSDELAIPKAMSAPLSQPAKWVPKKADFEQRLGGDTNKLKKLGEFMLPQIAAALPAALKKHEDRFLRCLMTEYQKSPKLMDCTAISLIGALIQTAQLGLELGGPAGQAYLIPFKGNCSLVIGYKGFLTLAHRSDKLKRCSPRMILTGDKWDIEYGTHQKLVHVPKFFESKEEERDAKREVVAYYSSIEMVNGGTDFEFLTPFQAEVWRSKHAMMKSGGPWTTNFDEMSLKTTIRRLCKRLPLSVESVAAATLDESADEEVDQVNEALVVFDGPPPDLAERMLEARKAHPLERDDV